MFVFFFSNGFFLSLQELIDIVIVFLIVFVKNPRYSFVAIKGYSEDNYIKVKCVLAIYWLIFYFKFELVTYSEDFFKIVLAITKTKLAIARFFEKDVFYKKKKKCVHK